MPNVQTSVAHMNFTTLPDETPPVWVGIGPFMTLVEDFTLAFDVALDEPSTVLWTVLPAGAVAPTVANVRAGQDGAGNPSVATGSDFVSAVNVNVTVTIHGGLSALTSYDVYLFAEVRTVPCVLAVVAHCLCSRAGDGVTDVNRTTSPYPTPRRLWCSCPQ